MSIEAVVITALFWFGLWWGRGCFPQRVLKFSAAGFEKSRYGNFLFLLREINFLVAKKLFLPHEENFSLLQRREGLAAGRNRQMEMNFCVLPSSFSFSL